MAYTLQDQILDSKEDNSFKEWNLFAFQYKTLPLQRKNVHVSLCLKRHGMIGQSFLDKITR